MMKDYQQLNGLALAYIGDAIYEVYIREYLLNQGQTKPNKLHQLATNYVSAKAQAKFMQQMLEMDILSEDEITFYKRGRNAKSYTSAKNADITTYRIATGFESLMGYLYLGKQIERLEALVEWCIEKERINDAEK